MATAVFAADDGTLPGTLEERLKLLEYWNSFSLDQYYDSIRAETFATEFLPFSHQEARAWLNDMSGKKLTEDEQSKYNSLVSRINDAIKKPQFSNGAFIKLSTRSPKDAVDKLGDKSVEILKQELIGIDTTNGEQLLLATRRAFFKIMRVTSAEEAMTLMMYSSRTISDLKRALELMEPEKFNLQIVIREFVQIPTEGEFRGIVYHKRLNAVTQYFTDCYFPQLKEQSERIKSRINDFFESVKGKIAYDDYIIDFAVLENSIKIVEINPYGENTGSGLFNWKNDQEVLQNGPLEIRVMSQPHSSAIVDGYLIGWKQLLEKAMPKAEESEKSDKKKCIVM